LFVVISLQHGTEVMRLLLAALCHAGNQAQAATVADAQLSLAAAVPASNQ
jgi:hypothetical protein